MVKSKSAGYICPSLKEKKGQRFSLAEGSLSDEAANSLLAPGADCDYDRGKYQGQSKPVSPSPMTRSIYNLYCKGGTTDACKIR